MKIIVIGAGVVGLSSAYWLAREGHDVTVVDREAAVGRGASYANGAQIAWCNRNLRDSWVVDVWAVGPSALCFEDPSPLPAKRRRRCSTSSFDARQRLQAFQELVVIGDLLFRPRVRGVRNFNPEGEHVLRLKAGIHPQDLSEGLQLCAVEHQALPEWARVGETATGKAGHPL